MLTCFQYGKPLLAMSHDTETKLTRMSGDGGGYLVFDPTGELFKKYGTP